jgi:NTE family protein
VSEETPALAALFSSERERTRFVAGGQTLYRAGERTGQLFFLRAGGLAAFRDAPGAPLLGVIRPGEVIGEMALLSGAPHSATIVALRDSEVSSLDAKAVFEAAQRTPEIMADIARLLIARARSPEPHGLRARPKMFGIAAIDGSVSARRIADALAGEMISLGFATTVLHAWHAAHSPGWWSEVEASSDHVLCAAESDEAAWSAICRRQVDRMILLGRGDHPSPPECGLCASEPLQANGLVDLVLLRRGGSRPEDPSPWLDLVQPKRLFHLRDGSRDDIARLGRFVTGTAVALVLSGGGARAFAHLGAVRALRGAGVPIDAVGGTSMGAIIAAGVALGWDGPELEARLRDSFVSSNPLDDVALPFVAMTRGRKVERKLAEHFGTVDIGSLDRPFFCVSTDLAGGGHIRHGRGRLVTALRASIALPGILPPVIDGARVLADGALLRNLPTDLMRADHDGPIVAVDVSRSLGLRPADIARPTPLAQWFWSGAWRRGPPIVSILMRSATIAAEPDLAAARETADLYVAPELGMIEIRDWRAFERAANAGEQAMTAALAGLDGPLTHLRHRRLAATRAMPM